MYRKIITLILILGISINSTGCVNNLMPKLSADDTTVSENPNITTNKEKIESKQLNSENTNLRAYDSKTSYNSVFEFNLNKTNQDETTLDDTSTFYLNIDGQVREFNLNQLCQLFNTLLSIEKLNYRLTEDMVYKYYIINEQNKIFNDIFTKATEVRNDEQFYRIIENTINSRYKKDVLAIKYKNKENSEYYIGNFTTRNAKNDINLEWTEANNEDEQVYLLTKLKEWNLQGLTTFYGDANNIKQNNFKAKGKMTLRQLLSFMTLNNAGTKTLRDIKVTPKRTITKEGKTIEQTIQIMPLDTEFDYKITYTGDQLVFETLTLTEAINYYYKVFPQYQVEDVNYKLTLDLTMENENEENNPINFNISSNSNATFVG